MAEALSLAREDGWRAFRVEEGPLDFSLVGILSRISAVLAETLVRTAFGEGGTLECGESVLRDKFGKSLPLRVFVRLRR